MYEVESTYSGCLSGPMDLEVTGTKEIDGKDAFVLHATTCSLWAQPYSVDGAGVAEAYVGSTKAWLRMLDAPVADGHTWTTTNGSATFDMSDHELGALETDAGSFDEPIAADGSHGKIGREVVPARVTGK